MRIRNPILTYFISTGVIFLLLANVSDARDLLFEDRGFQENHCYSEVAAISCSPVCRLVVFPDSSGTLNFEIDSHSFKKPQAAIYYLVNFKLLKLGITRVVQPFQFTPLLSSVGRAKMNSGGFLAHEMNCPSDLRSKGRK
jgi:hypothetical protein